MGRGDPKDVICRTVKKLDADTLVMGSHGYGFVMRYPATYISSLISRVKNVSVDIVDSSTDL